MAAVGSGRWQVPSLLGSAKFLFTSAERCMLRFMELTRLVAVSIGDMEI